MNNKLQKDCEEKKTIFGFWLYIMSDCILFASLFATYAVLNNNILFSNTEKSFFNLYLVFLETFFLLFSSITYSMVTANIKNFFSIKKSNFWMILTLLLGLCFIFLELFEFYHLIKIGNNPSYNAFFSAFFILVGTHGIHVILGLIWIIIMIIQITKNGLTKKNKIRLQCLGIFWHFLDIIWICVFSEVYLMGSI